MVIGEKKGVPTAASWFIKTRVIGIIAVVIWAFIFLFCLLFLEAFFGIRGAIRWILSIIIPSIIVVPMVIGYNKKYVTEWKASKSPENLQKSKTIATIFMIVIGLLILFAFVGPLFFDIETLEKITDSSIFYIVMGILFFVFVYYRFIKKEKQKY